MGLIYINVGSTSPATLIGRVISTTANESNIYLKVKPSYFFIILSILFTILGLVVFVHSLLIREPNFISLLYLIVPLIMGLIAFHTQQYHRKEFERALGIEFR